jgi:SAM-dependent methyltransferase
MNREVSLCDANAKTSERTWAFYLNIPMELEAGFLSESEQKYLQDYYSEAGLLRGYRRAFFKHHFSMTFHHASRFLLESKDTPTILDLGCGSGTQSLLLSLLGARVVGVDMDEVALGILEKRRRFYEEQAGRSLDLSVHCVDSFKFDYAAIAPIDGVHSTFAFNMMQPSSKLISTIEPHLAEGARIAILDGNSISWLPRFWPPRRRNAWSPRQFRAELERRGFAITYHRGGVALAPLFWACGLTRLMTGIDGILSRNWLFPISHQILAQRVP